jgi:hypothetical protein
MSVLLKWENELRQIQLFRDSKFPASAAGKFQGNQTANMEAF